MRITKTFLVVGAVALYGFTSASAEVTVTGEAKAYSSQISRLQLSVNASGGDGAASGSAQYTRLTGEGSPELELDMPVSCMWVADDAQRVVMAGPATVTSNPRSAAVDEWFVIALQKKPAEKERIRTLFATQREATAKCANGETLFPAIVDSGGFEITQGEAGQSNLLGTGRHVNIDPDRVGGSRDFPLPDPGLNIDAKASLRCSAYFPFNGSLEDSTGNGHDAMMVGLDRLPTGSPAQFQRGKFGQALRLSGDSVAVAPLDLHFDDCPTVTISAWVHLLSEPPGQIAIVSTGYGAGPRLALSKSNASAWGGANEIRTRSRDWAPETGVWFPIVAVWDYESGTHTLYTRGNEGALTEELGNYSREPQQDLWIGAYAYGSTLLNVATDILIDDLRVYDRILGSDEISAALAGTLPVGSDCDCGTSAAGQIPLSGTLPNQGTGLGETEFLQQVGDHDFSGNTPVIDPEDFPDRPTEVLPEGGAGGILDAPPTAGGGLNDAGIDPNLSLPEGSPGQELQQEIDAARNATWVAPEPEPAFSCENPGEEAVTSTSFGALPAKYTEALQQARICKLPITAIALNGAGQWVISTAQQVAYSSNIPSEMASRIDEHVQAGRGLDAVDIASNSKWVVVSGKNFAESGLPSRAVNRIQAALGSFRRIASFSFHPSSGSTWLMVDSDGTVYGENIPSKILDAIEQSVPTERVFHQARYAPDGGWILLANDLWFVTDGASSSVLSSLDSARLARRRVNHIVFLDSESKFTVVSNEQEPARNSDPIWWIENNMNNSNIWKRMRAHQLTGVSIAVVRNNEISWVRGYGLRQSGDRESYVFPDTVFDAASISKPIAAFSALQVVEAGGMTLESEGVLEDLEVLFTNSQRKTYREAIRPEVGNLVQVLQHCASICYEYTSACAETSFNGGGAGQYPPSAVLPAPAEMILGIGNAQSNRKISRTGNNGIRFGYTSGNYMLVQALIDVNGGGFLAHTDGLLSDLGMVKSTYRTPFSGRNGDKFARGHQAGVMQPLYAYPETAAASLTSTPADIAKFVIAVNENDQSLLSSGMVDKFLGRDSSVMQYCGSPTTMALGVNYQSSNPAWNGQEAFWHGGLHNGYRTRMVGLPGAQSGVVVFMTGSLSGADRFFAEFRTAVSTVYGL